MKVPRIAGLACILFAASLALPAFAQENPAPAASAESKNAKPSPASLARGHEVLLAAAKAAGGDSLRSVATLEFVEKGTMITQQGPMDISAKWLVAYPDKVHAEVTLPTAKVLQIYDGKSAWIESPQGVMDVPASINGEFQRGITLFGGWGLYQAVLNGAVEGQYLGEEQMDGKKADAVNWNAPFGIIKLYFDSASHLLIAADFVSTGAQGPVEAVEHWSDFRSVSGRQFPYHTMLYRSGTKLSDTTVQEVNVNPSLDPSLFAKPTAPAPAQQP